MIPRDAHLGVELLAGEGEGGRQELVSLAGLEDVVHAGVHEGDELRGPKGADALQPGHAAVREHVGPEGAALGEGEDVERKELEGLGEDELPARGGGRAVLAVGVEDVHAGGGGLLARCRQGPARDGQGCLAADVHELRVHVGAAVHGAEDVGAGDRERVHSDPALACADSAARGKKRWSGHHWDNQEGAQEVDKRDNAPSVLV